MGGVLKKWRVGWGQRKVAQPRVTVNRASLSGGGAWGGAGKFGLAGVEPGAKKLLHQKCPEKLPAVQKKN